MIRIAIAEDHALVRDGLRRLLESEPIFTVVGEAATGLEAVEIAERLAPDVLLLDLTLPRLHGLDVLTRLQSRKRTKALIVSMHGDPPSVLEALRLGACGFCLKESPASDLLQGIRTVNGGGCHVSASLEHIVLRAAVEQTKPESKPMSLTRRERLVLQKVAGGLSTKSIGQELGISPSTVSKHRFNIGRKLGTKTQADMVIYAMRHKLVET